MIFLAVLLWIQVSLLVALGIGAVYVSAQDRSAGPRVAFVSAVIFTFFTAVSVTAALVVGGLA